MDEGDVLHLLIKDLVGSITMGLTNATSEVAEDIEEITPPAPPVVPANLVDKDGNIYTTVTIGAQTWIAENFRSTKYADGSAISNITNNALWAADTTGAYCWYNNDSATYKADYGALYNWYATNNISGLAYLERGGVSESGWRVPTETDLENLVSYLGGDTVGGGKLKEVGITHWTAPNTGATDEVGFASRGAGLRNASGEFVLFGWYNYIISSTEASATLAYRLGTIYDVITCGVAQSDKVLGFSVRLVKDAI